jgi:hypothetical protein
MQLLLLLLFFLSFPPGICFLPFFSTPYYLLSTT